MDPLRRPRPTQRRCWSRPAATGHTGGRLVRGSRWVRCLLSRRIGRSARASASTRWVTRGVAMSLRVRRRRRSSIRPAAIGEDSARKTLRSRSQAGTAFLQRRPRRTCRGIACWCGPGVAPEAEGHAMRWEGRSTCRLGYRWVSRWCPARPGARGVPSSRDRVGRAGRCARGAGCDRRRLNGIRATPVSGIRGGAGKPAPDPAPTASGTETWGESRSRPLIVPRSF